MNVATTGGAVGVGTPAANPRIHQAAVQFEAMLLQQLTKPLTSGFSSEDDGSGEAKEAGPLQSFAGEAVASSLAKSGALGFARQIVETLAKSASKKMSENSSSPVEGRR